MELAMLDTCQFAKFSIPFGPVRVRHMRRKYSRDELKRSFFSCKSFDNLSAPYLINLLALIAGLRKW